MQLCHPWWTHQYRHRIKNNDFGLAKAMPVSNFGTDDEDRIESDHRDGKGSETGSILQESAVRLTALLLLTAIELHTYCFDIFNLSQTIN